MSLICKDRKLKQKLARKKIKDILSMPKEKRLDFVASLSDDDRAEITKCLQNKSLMTQIKSFLMWFDRALLKMFKFLWKFFVIILTTIYELLKIIQHVPSEKKNKKWSFLTNAKANKKRINTSSVIIRSCRNNERLYKIQDNIIMSCNGLIRLYELDNKVLKSCRNNKRLYEIQNNTIISCDGLIRLYELDGNIIKSITNNERSYEIDISTIKSCQNDEKLYEIDGQIGWGVIMIVLIHEGKIKG